MLRDRLKIDAAFIEELNHYFADPSNSFINEILSVVEKYGTPDEINEQARQSRKLSNLLDRLKNQDSPYLKDLEWLASVRDKGAFIPVSQYRREILGDKANSMSFSEDKAVTLEISALQYFPWQIHTRTKDERTRIRQRRYTCHSCSNADSGRKLRRDP
jgi:hypothetical protein